MSEPLTILASSIQLPCSEGDYCKNSPSNSIRPECNWCRLSPDKLWSSLSKWEPVDGKRKHPILEKEKREAKRGKAIERAEKKKAKDRSIQKRSKAADRAEGVTQRHFIRATKNSGRSLKDGDHSFNNDSVLLDTKLQASNENVVVKNFELDKARAQAKKHNKAAGGLVIRNKSGRGLVVFDERDFAAIFGSKQ